MIMPNDALDDHPDDCSLLSILNKKKQDYPDENIPTFSLMYQVTVHVLGVGGGLMATDKLRKMSPKGGAETFKEPINLHKNERSTYVINEKKNIKGTEDKKVSMELDFIRERSDSANNDKDTQPFLTTGFQGHALTLQQRKSAETRKNSSSAFIQQQRLAGANATDVLDKPTALAKTFEINYPFYRWQGEHSVRVFFPLETGKGGVTLLPSDPHAAEVLSRNLAQLPSLSPNLLEPEKDKNEHERRQRNDGDEEEQE